MSDESPAETPSSDDSPKARAKAEAKRHGKLWELRQMPAQRWLNQFCENWIFAFIVAMTIRHFALEAYRIPTASMEPMLFGDEAVSKADHVVVDKLLFRFTGPDRWGVTVFQFPWPEVAGPAGPAQPVVAWDGEGGRSDRFPFNPQMNRNFVKRCVVQPGDDFFIRGGDIHVRQEDGSFSVPAKPAAIQDALWLPIYEQGSQNGNLRWQAKGGSSVADDGGTLVCQLSEQGRIHFDQPLWNLYVKSGPVNVRRSGSASPLTRVDVSLTEPRFSIKEGAREIDGSIWDLNRWEVRRVTTKDLDSASHGAQLNQRMTEWVGDLKVDFLCSELTGQADVVLAEGSLVELRLRLRGDGWAVLVDGAEVAGGSEAPTGSRWTMINVDDRVSVLRDGEAVADPVAVSPTNPEVFEQRSALWLEGSGSLRAARLTVARDVHYCRSGFLADESGLWAQSGAVGKHNLVVMRRQMIEALVDEDLKTRLVADLDAALDRRRATAWLKPIGDSPERALRAPEDAYLLMGDNSPFSWDGRNWGWVPAANLRGQVLVAAMLPLGRWKLVR
ncbi:MAG: S26 family signal peptidase [Planctomycetota bacterium]|jgi:signal peptidase I|nr:S26 family signal peptidase [Planctomycetota bacterium]